MVFSRLPTITLVFRDEKIRTRQVIAQNAPGEYQADASARHTADAAATKKACDIAAPENQPDKPVGHNQRRAVHIEYNSEGMGEIWDNRISQPALFNLPPVSHNPVRILF